MRVHSGSGPAAIGARLPSASRDLERFKILAAFAAIYFIWGTSFLAIRIAVEAVPPFTLVALRCSIGAVALVAFQAVRRRPLLPSHEWGWIILTGAMMFLGSHGLLAIVQQRTPSGIAALMLSATPLWLLVLDALFCGRGIGARAATGALTGIAGVALLTFGAGRSTAVIAAPAAAMLLASGLCWAVASLMTARRMRGIDPIGRAAGQLLAGAALATLVGFAVGERVEPPFAPATAGVLLYLGLASSALTFCTYTWLLTKLSPALVGTYALVNPVVALAAGTIIAQEPLTSRILAAGVLVILAVLLVLSGSTGTRATRRSAPRERPWRAAAGERRY